MDDADDKEREALLLRSKTTHGSTTTTGGAGSRRGTGSPRPAQDRGLWWRSDDKISDKRGYADLFAVPIGVVVALREHWHLAHDGGHARDLLPRGDIAGSPATNLTS